MTTDTKVQSKGSAGEFFGKIIRNQLFIPIVALTLLVIFNLISDPGFFKIALEPSSTGNLILSGNLTSR